MKGYRIHGGPTELEPLLNRILVHCEVSGLEEAIGHIDVWIRDDSPDLPDSGALLVTAIDPVDDSASDWRRDDRPIAVADDLLVRPPWVEPPPGFTGTELVVPRGMAFGSGEHESTKLALLVLREVLGQGGSFADVGTGSGILALYAKQRGCTPILACDLEIESVSAARQLIPEIVVCHGGPETLLPQGPVDHVVANLFARELVACAPALLRLWNGHGALVVAGMRHDETESVFAALPSPPALLRRGDEFVAAAIRSSRGPDQGM